MNVSLEGSIYPNASLASDASFNVGAFNNSVDALLKRNVFGALSCHRGRLSVPKVILVEKAEVAVHILPLEQLHIILGMDDKALVPARIEFNHGLTVTR